MAFEADFIFILNVLGAAAGCGYAGYATHGAGDDRGICRCVLDGMRIVTINALDVPD
jgi:hypothetical protein